MRAIVGYTGFVGSNLYTAQRFERAFNSGNITDAWGLQPDLLIYAGMRAEKYLANTDPDRDLRLVQEAEENMERIAPKKLVLISTIDVLSAPNGKTESAPAPLRDLQPYGYHRLLLEQWVRERYPDALIVRLPGLFGKNIKKNFIYDYIHRLPQMLRAEKLQALSATEPLIRESYQQLDNGFWRIKPLDADARTALREAFDRAGFSALHFTDSRSVYQFYPLARLYEDIQTALRQDLKLLHLATEPVSAGELYRFLTGEEFINELPGRPAFYDFRTEHAPLFGGQGGYILPRDGVLEAIARFVREYP